MRVRKISASHPSAVTKLNTRSVGQQAAEQSRSARLRNCRANCLARTPEDGRKFPGEIDRSADPGVLALPADRTVDVRGIAEQEGAAFAELFGYAMMHVPSAAGRAIASGGAVQHLTPPRLRGEVGAERRSESAR
jgi:hypothetical protein